MLLHEQAFQLIGEGVVLLIFLIVLILIVGLILGIILVRRNKLVMPSVIIFIVNVFYSPLKSFANLLGLDDSLVDNILKRDIEQRYKISYKAAFENMAHHLLNVSPTIVVTTDLANQFHFKSEHTAKNYVKYLKEAYMLIGIQKYSQKSKLRSVQEKVYALLQGDFHETGT